MNRQSFSPSEEPSESGRLLESGGDETIRSYPIDNGAYVTEIPKETLKSLFYLVAGRPDSIRKSLKGEIVVTPDDIVELNRAVGKKLEHFEISGSTTSITIAYDNNTTHEFGSWAEFISTDWNDPNVTQSVTIKWDFLAKLPNYAMPQRHTATVQIQDSSLSSKLLRNMKNTLGVEMGAFAVRSDGITVNLLDAIFPSVTCKIDFINPLLGNEFLNIVEKWHKARSESLPDAGWLEFMVKRKRAIVILIRYLMFGIISLLACALLHYLLQKIGLNEVLKVKHIELVMFWLIGTGLLLTITNRIAKKLSGTVLDSLEDINNSTIFNMTKGDKNKRKRIEKENDANKMKFLWNLIVSIAIKIIAGVAATWLLTAKGI